MRPFLFLDSPRVSSVKIGTILVLDPRWVNDRLGFQMASPRSVSQVDDACGEVTVQVDEGVTAVFDNIEAQSVAN